MKKVLLVALFLPQFFVFSMNCSELTQPLTSAGQLVFGRSLSCQLSCSEPDSYYNSAYTGIIPAKALSIMLLAPVLAGEIAGAELKPFFLQANFQTPFRKRYGIGASINYFLEAQRIEPENGTVKYILLMITSNQKITIHERVG